METVNKTSKKAHIYREIGSFDSYKTKRVHCLNLPQIIFGGLSENWLMKEIGDMHWEMVCNGFKKESRNILDEDNNRLYAAFVRVRYESTHSFNGYGENEILNLTGDLSRFGTKMFFSNIHAMCNDKAFNANLITAFARKTLKNKKMESSNPTGTAKCDIKSLSCLPDFGKEYLVKKTRNSSPTDDTIGVAIKLGGEEFNLENLNLFETEYNINPYTDLNGANLLYFASYPQIHDICEREYFNQLGNQFDIEDDWALSVSTVARDVFYFGNCDIEDRIGFVINNCEYLDNYKIKISSSLYRKVDDFRIADIFTIKQLTYR